MTDYERKRRDECIKLRGQHNQHLREIESLKNSLASERTDNRVLQQKLEVALARLEVWNKAFGIVRAKDPGEPERKEG